MTKYDVIDSRINARSSAGHTLWGALALARDRNQREHSPGRYIVRPGELVDRAGIEPARVGV